MVATEGLLKKSVEKLFLTLRSKRASKETRVRGILEFHFTNEAAVRFFLEDMGMVEEGIESSALRCWATDSTTRPAPPRSAQQHTVVSERTSKILDGIGPQL